MIAKVVKWIFTSLIVTGVTLGLLQIFGDPGGIVEFALSAWWAAVGFISNLFVSFWHGVFK